MDFHVLTMKEGMQTKMVPAQPESLPRKSERPQEKVESGFLAILKNEIGSQEKSQPERKPAESDMRQARLDAAETRDHKADSERKQEGELKDAGKDIAKEPGSDPRLHHRVETRSEIKHRPGHDLKFDAPVQHKTSFKIEDKHKETTLHPKFAVRIAHEAIERSTRSAQTSTLQSKKQATERQGFQKVEFAIGVAEKKLSLPSEKKESIEPKTNQEPRVLLNSRKLPVERPVQAKNETSHNPEQAKKPEKERTVVVHLDQEKWKVQEAPVQRFASQGERQGQNEEKKASGKDARIADHRSRPKHSREAVFAELLKPQIAPVDRERLTQETKALFNQLVEKAKINYGSDGSSSASIRLKPDQLGNVTLNLKVHGNVVEARLLVENDSVKKLVKEEVDHLQKELKRQGFSVDAIEIRVREPQTESQTAFNPGAFERGSDAQQHLRQNATFVNSFSVPVSSDAAALEYEPISDANYAVNISV